MTWIGIWLNEKIERDLRFDKMIFGVSIYHLYYRHPLNPLRYILGERKVTRLNPRAVIIDKR